MAQHGKQEPFSSGEISSMLTGSRELSPSLSGKAHPRNTAQKGNLAIKRSLIDIFDEFTDVISGELKSMNLEQAKTELAKKAKKPK